MELRLNKYSKCCIDSQRSFVESIELYRDKRKHYLKQPAAARAHQAPSQVQHTEADPESRRER